MDVILGHVNVDFDALASMAAAKKLYPEAVMVFAGAVNRNVREFIALHGDVLEFMEPRALDVEAVTRLIVVDNRIAERLGEFRDLVGRPGIEVFVYDHHPPSPQDMVGVKDHSEQLGATTTVLLKIIRRKGIAVTPFEATLFALGIHEDTGSLTFAGTTHEDAETLSYLMRQGANLGVIMHFLSPPLTSLQHELMKRLLTGLEFIRVKGVLVAVATAGMEEYVEGASLIAGKLAELENLDVLFTLSEMHGRVVVVGLSRLDQVNVDEILYAMGGGGHAKAGSAVMKGFTLERARSRVIELLEEKVRPLVTAGQIMSGPVKTLTEETPIIEASRRMERTGHTAFPVVDESGTLTGIISRKDLDKAGHHGLGHAPVKGFMSRNLISVDEKAPLQEIQALMTGNAIGRVPVVRDGRVIGIVTRKDVIRALHGADYLRGFAPPGRVPGYKRAEIIELMQRALPGEMQALLRNISRTAEAGGYNVFLVGGVVRDLLLGFPNLDLDLVVEGEGIEFARLLARELKARVRSHRKFGTAVIILPNGRRIDVATARTEFYEYPAALPTVEISSVKQDLYRRDFTINAMAIALSGERFGELLDFFGGLRDLQRRQVRILHNLSFVEDPTRIFRAVRFEQRYGFQLETQTEMLARRAVEMEIVGKLTNARVRDELIDIFSEPQPLPLRAVERLQDLGALRTLHHELCVSQAMRGRYRMLERHGEKAAELAGEGMKRWVPPLVAMLEELPGREAEKWCHLMRFKREDTQAILQCLGRVPETIRALSTEMPPPSRIAGFLDPLAGEALAYLYVLGGPGIRDVVELYVNKWKYMETEIDGNDLAGLGLAPSRIYAEILGAVRDARLDGEVESREEELEMARRLVKKAKKG
ncbi:MAG: CBS domain-containing protein [Actinomycetota bacterium]|nr:CBS domain-containing protein [Actinomycetota bacterium]MDD5667877.1 CBS domain-containing protein [Actinomycetota bacterium]